MKTINKIKKHIDTIEGTQKIFLWLMQDYFRGGEIEITLGAKDELLRLMAEEYNQEKTLKRLHRMVKEHATQDELWKTRLLHSKIWAEFPALCKVVLVHEYS